MEQELLLFFEYNYGDFFERTKIDVLNAEYRLNMKLQLYQYVSLNDFFECLGLPVTEFGDDVGWYLDTGNRPNAWINFDWEYVELEDGMECHIINLPQVEDGMERHSINLPLHEYIKLAKKSEPFIERR